VRPNRAARHVRMPGCLLALMLAWWRFGAVRVGDTVRRAGGLWTLAVHSLLAHLAVKGFVGSPGRWGWIRWDRRCRVFAALLDWFAKGS